jgi:hypothetical protein
MLTLVLSTALAAPFEHRVDATSTADSLYAERSAFCPGLPVSTRAISGGVTLFGDLEGLGINSMEIDAGIRFSAGWYGLGIRDASVTGTFWGVETSTTCAPPYINTLLRRRESTGDSVLPDGEIRVRCPAGYSVIGGSFRTTGGPANRVISASAPVGAQSWRGEWKDLNPSTVELERIYPEVALTCMPNAQYAARIVRTYAEAGGPGQSTAVAYCPPGAQVVGGGAEVLPAVPGVVLTASAPDVVGAPGTGWVASAHEVEPAVDAWVVVATAICLMP